MCGHRAPLRVVIEIGLCVCHQMEHVAIVTATEDELRLKAAAEQDGWSDEEPTESARERKKVEMRSRLLAATGSAVMSGIASPIRSSKKKAATTK